MPRKRNKPSLYEAMRTQPPAASQPASRGALSWFSRRGVAAASTEWDWNPAPRPTPRDAEPVAVEPEPQPLPPAPMPEPEPEPVAAAEPRGALFDTPPAAPVGEPGLRVPLFDFVGGRVQLSFGVVGCMVAAASVCVLCMLFYATGKRNSARPAGTTPALALTASVPVESNRGAADVGLIGSLAKNTPATASPRDEEVRKLLEGPPARQSAPPAASPIPPAAPQADAHKPLQVLQIETFRFGVAERRNDVLAELNDARKFLADRGVETTYRETPREFILLSSKGFASQREPAAVQLKADVERIGREYRKAAGRYEFKDTFYRREPARSGQAGGTSQE